MRSLHSRRTNTESTDHALHALFETARSPVMQNIARTIERIAPSDLGVLFVGENGTGKNWTARLVHRLSNRTNKRFVELHCRSIRENIEERIFGYEAYTRSGIEVNSGALEDANGGTIFFNEIGDLPLLVQRTVARALEHQYIRHVGGRQDTPINVRFIAALDRKPDMMLEDGMLRKEIYHRVSPIIINLPPLRERREDIPFLIDQFLPNGDHRKAQDNLMISQQALEVCLAYDWPGNVRQLRNAIEYAVLMCHGHTIQTEHLPLYVHGKQRAEMLEMSLKSLCNEIQRQEINDRLVSDR
jgi:DNA-binding NtrC family response regulator